MPMLSKHKIIKCDTIVYNQFDDYLELLDLSNLLLEDLTVYQNLYYNAKLCFGNLDEITIIEKVNETLLKGEHIGSQKGQAFPSHQPFRIDLEF